MSQISANNPVLKSWIEVSSGSDFPIQNIPFGVVKSENLTPRVVSRIGNKVIDLKTLHVLGYLENLPFELSDFDVNLLNPMMKKGKKAVRDLRNRLSKLFDVNQPDLQKNEQHVAQVLIPVENVCMCMPVQIGDYTDFYSSREHATNVGMMFRDPANALLPNWLWLPVGYHGRSSSVIISGEPVYRPKGQIKPNPEEPPIYAPCRNLDFELETAFVTFDGKPLGESISTEEAEEYIFGMVLFNDWSARDIQTWEYVPLGPFLAKNFASSISPWIVTLDALQPYKADGPAQDPEVLSYLKYKGQLSYDIQLEVFIEPENGEETKVCTSNFKYMYWNMAQQLAHHTVNGCNIRCGDLMGSGTISGPTPDSYGSMLELAWKGTRPLKMNDGSERRFLQDGDTVTMRGFSSKDGIRIGFGEVSGKIYPPKG
ncbi:fumarylacetoacetase [Fluviicola sp.]|jgi:fumarylacetoacetase|uniref:fumarylacetoacetase n=1 Tax=Fluviicola sp. TaxID=1917219 RepID=UPI00282304B1|nr:fumarylacetoacetase [Fluviicola sp.]MDR0801044.1 fumarylacetoacetase [Fluviicola sp.]